MCVSTVRFPFLLKALENYFQAVRKGDAVMVESLLQSGSAGVDDRTPEGLTALMIAAVDGRNEVAKRLIANEASVNATDPVSSCCCFAYGSRK